MGGGSGIEITGLSNDNGYNNTTKIIEQLSGKTDNNNPPINGAPAAEYCRNYQWKANPCNIIGKGYLPLISELNIIKNNINNIAPIFKKFNKEIEFMSDGNFLIAFYKYWSCEFQDSENAQCITHSKLLEEDFDWKNEIEQKNVELTAWPIAQLKL